MRIGELKRAVEDVILRPDENRVDDLTKRDTLAALDLCQPGTAAESLAPPEGPTAAGMNACSASSETVPGSTCSEQPRGSSRPPPALCTSTSLDTIVYRHVSSRGASRRSSRVLPHFTSKRKRSNSVSSCYKNQGQNHQATSWTASHTPVPDSDSHPSCSAPQWSLASSESHSSVAQDDAVQEEDELEINPYLCGAADQSLHQHHHQSISPCPLPYTNGGFHNEAGQHFTNHSSFTMYRETRDDDAMECD